MGTEVTASIVIDYGTLSADNAHISAAIVAEDNDGKTSFAMGDTVKFRVYTGNTYDVIPSSGSVSGGVKKTGLLSNGGDKEVVQFVRTNKASVSLPIKSGLSIDWFGNNPGAVTNTEWEITAGADTSIVAVGEADYTTEWYEHTVTFPSGVTGSAYAIVIVLVVTG